MSRPDVADAEAKNRGGFRNHRWAGIHNTVRLAADELVGHHLHHPAPGSRGCPRRRCRRRRSVMARPRSVGCSAREKDRKGIGQDPAARRNRVRHEAAGMAQREPAAAYARTARARDPGLGVHGVDCGEDGQGGPSSTGGGGGGGGGG